jgi:hypothetical protein
MNRCAGCDREADKQIKESSLFICTPCTKLVPQIPSKSIAEPSYCPECDERMWHGEIICRTCLDGTLSAAASAAYEIPAVLAYELALPIIRFQQSLDLYGAQSYSEWEYRFHSDGHWHSIDFTEYHERIGVLKKLEPRCCEFCGASMGLRFTNPAFGGFYQCYGCVVRISTWLYNRDLLDENPFAELMLAGNSGLDNDDTYNVYPAGPDGMGFAVEVRRVQKEFKETS